jgi:hypothetical protein
MQASFLTMEELQTPEVADTMYRARVAYEKCTEVTAAVAEVRPCWITRTFLAKRILHASYIARYSASAFMLARHVSSSGITRTLLQAFQQVDLVGAFLWAMHVSAWSNRFSMHVMMQAIQQVDPVKLEAALAMASEVGYTGGVVRGANQLLKTLKVLCEHAAIARWSHLREVRGPAILQER